MRHFQEFSMTFKRLLLTLGVLLILLIGVSIYSIAILFPNTAQTSFSTPTITPVSTKISSVYRVEGTIQSLGNQTLVIALAHENKTITVGVNDKTTYATPDGSATFSDLKIGELVEVRSHTDSFNATTILAVRIIIKSAVA
jgi:hypothetical protein